MSTDGFQPDAHVRRDFVQWLKQFDERYTKAWHDRLRNNPQAAMCEAMFWAILTSYDVTVAPSDSLNGQRPFPDFRCNRLGSEFYVETTCITNTTVENNCPPVKTKLTEAKRDFRMVNHLILREISDKVRQFAGLNAPGLLGVGFFHQQANGWAIRPGRLEWLLSGEPTVAIDFDPRLGQAVGPPRQVTGFERCAFTRATEALEIDHNRQPVSGLLIGGFGCEPLRLYGLLHPAPAREFDPRILPRVPFALQRLDLDAGRVSIEWIQTFDGWDAWAG